MLLIKKTLLIIICLLGQITPSIAQEYAIVRGKCVSEMGNDVQLFCAKNGVAVQYAATNVAADSTFAFMFSVTENGFYYLSSGTEYSRLYITKGCQINVVAKDGVFRMIGDKSIENTVLDSCRTFYHTINKSEKEVPYGDFFPLFDKINNHCQEIINNSSSDIKESLRFHVEMDLLNSFVSYVGKNQKSYISEEQDNKYYKRIIAKFPCTDDRILKLPYGIDMLNRYFTYKNSFVIRNSSYNLDVKLAEIESGTLKAEYILSQLDFKDYKTFCDYELKYHHLMCNDNQRSRLSFPSNRPRCLTKSGERAPNFICKDSNGQFRSMSEFKGKYILIDFWATWCAPCKKEIPYLQQLEEYFKEKDVVFVSISVDTNIPKWKDYITNNKLGGVQLSIGSFENLPQELHLGSIPRFMIIDPNGNFVDDTAPRPSNNKLKETLKSLLRCK